MKLKLIAVMAMALTGVFLAGCKKSSASRYGREEPIKGSPSDPPVSFQTAWGSSNRYLFHLDAAATSEEPRRNAGDPLSREVTFGLDFGLAVTNVASDGGRVLEMDIQGVQFRTLVDDRVTVSFDSGYENLNLDDSPLAARLQRLIGSRVTFQFSPDNKVRRAFGLKEINDRLNERQTNSSRSAMRGLAGSVLSQYFAQNFWKDVLEVSALPTNEVRVGDTWTVTRETTSGPNGGRATAELVYTFKGWQEHLKHRCARLEFSGTLKAGGKARDRILRNLSGTNAPAPPPANPPDGEPGTMSGVTWFSPELGLPVETIIDQTTTTKIVTSSRRATVVRGANAPPGTNSPGGPANLVVATTNAPQQTSYDLTRRQHVNLRLMELTPGAMVSSAKP